jgi:hypothetical protein
MGRRLEWMVMSITGALPRENDVVWEGLGHGHWATKPLGRPGYAVQCPSTVCYAACACWSMD